VANRTDEPANNEEKMTMKKIMFATAIVLASPLANAADRISYPSNVLGKWCLTSVEDGWRHFKRGNKCSDATLVLKQNGDYVLSSSEHEERCKADPKSNFKGWMDYACTNIFGHTETRNQKFVIDVDTGELSQSYD
jgi:hypothetical protein